MKDLTNREWDTLRDLVLASLSKEERAFYPTHKEQKELLEKLTENTWETMAKSWK